MFYFIYYYEANMELNFQLLNIINNITFNMIQISLHDINNETLYIEILPFSYQSVNFNNSLRQMPLITNYIYTLKLNYHL